MIQQFIVAAEHCWHATGSLANADGIADAFAARHKVGPRDGEVNVQDQLLKRFTASSSK